MCECGFQWRHILMKIWTLKEIEKGFFSIKHIFLAIVVLGNCLFLKEYWYQHKVGLMNMLFKDGWFNVNAYSSMVLEITPVFKEIRVSQSSVFCGVFCRPLLVFCAFLFAFALYASVREHWKGNQRMENPEKLTTWRRQTKAKNTPLCANKYK